MEKKAAKKVERTLKVVMIYRVDKPVEVDFQPHGIEPTGKIINRLHIGMQRSYAVRRQRIVVASHREKFMDVANPPLDLRVIKEPDESNQST